MEAMYFNRDISWLSFNERVLQEAADRSLPVMDRLQFLSIFSSNLDEFYSVRVPIATAMEKLQGGKTLSVITDRVNSQMKYFGSIFQDDLIPYLASRNVNVLFNQQVPDFLQHNISQYFFSRVMGYLQPILLSQLNDPHIIQNNKLQLLAMLKDSELNQQVAIVNVPVDYLSRFYVDDSQGVRTILFLEDLIKANLAKVFPQYQIGSVYSFKITRDAELDLRDEYKGSLVKKLEKKLKMRAFGLPSRFLYEPGLPPEVLRDVARRLGLEHASLVPGGHYHNLRDLAALPVPAHSFSPAPSWTPKKHEAFSANKSIFSIIREKDLIVHTPYQAYDPVLRFFNEAAQDPEVKAIDLTIYRVATESQILHALISAARNGKNVTVYVELKARFDEANNLRWAKRMKTAGIRIIYSEPSLKIHAKLALVRKKTGQGWRSFSLLATGNLNENTALYYTDHVLLTANKAFAEELKALLLYLKGQSRSEKEPAPYFEWLLVSPFNLQQRFIELIDQEIAFARQGLEAAIIIKLNNLEEKILIQKLYEASEAGVSIRLIIRGVCCLIPGVQGMSTNIRVIRIVDRFLEHGRVFCFHHNADKQVFAGSADWMNRNIYHRVEVCFPILDKDLKTEILQLLEIQWEDNAKAVQLDRENRNIPIARPPGEESRRSQEIIYGRV